MRRTLNTVAAALTATLLGMTAASATVFTKDYHGAGVWNAYDDQKQTYSMKFRDDGSKDGFWLVVSPGDNPKTHVNEYAILYGDRAANRITAYTYDGKNSKDSYKTGQYLGTFDNAFTSGGTDFTMFALDVSSINNAFNTPDWDGVSFGDKTGIWFHQSSGTQFAYNGDGTIANFVISGQMWLDQGNMTTTRRSCTDRTSGKYYCKTGTTPNGPNPAPAPGGLALVLMGLAGFGLRRKQ